MVFLGRMIRDLDDIEDFKKWLQTKDARAARLEKEKKEKLERALIEPKHMMDASDHYKAKEAIEEAQTSAIALGSKRKAELDAKEAKKIQKKKNKKWYEASSDEEEAKEEIKVRPPSEIRNSQLSEKRQARIKKKFGEMKPKDEIEKPKFMIKDGMVRVAKLDEEVIEREAEIWEDDFLDSADPELIAQYKIEKREKAYQEKLAKEKEEAEKLSSADQSEVKKTANENEEQDFQDVDLDQFSSAEELGKLGLEHIKHLLKIRGLKCGGNLEERSKRLFSVRGLSPEQYPKKICAKPAKK